MNKIKITIEFSEDIKGEYFLHDNLVQRINDGQTLTMRTQHPGFSETFIAEVEKR